MFSDSIFPYLSVIVTSQVIHHTFLTLVVLLKLCRDGFPESSFQVPFDLRLSAAGRPAAHFLAPKLQPKHGNNRKDSPLDFLDSTLHPKSGVVEGLMENQETGREQKTKLVELEKGIEGNKSEKEKRRQKQRILAIFFGSLGVCLLAWVLPHSIKEEEVLEVFGKYEEAFSWWKILSPFGRVAQFLILLGMAALNVTFVTSNFLSLPKRDPTETANMSKYFVAWLESPMVICFGCLTMALFMHAACSGADVAGMVKCLRFTGSFSALRTLQMASPFNAMNEILETYRNKGLAMAAVSFLHLSFFAPVAVMAVLVKLSQVDFATETIVDHWSPFQFLAFAAFINNLAGLRGDISKERKLAIFKSQDSRDPEAVLDVWEKQLGTTLQKLYGFLPALVLIGTLSVDDVCHLLNPTIRYHRYHLVSE
ncbi:unnamed protein product [Cladocopium goreaui]|uniref:Uncharacterized protein n=1 Tax=Cladocopium goreaui TaxID=2562237 RepID=A0A9P1FS21_9DINO|nr:unnamed protein product [Cladocopium goreaui]